MTLSRCVGPFNPKGQLKRHCGENKKEKKSNKVTQKDTHMEAFSPLPLMSTKNVTRDFFIIILRCTIMQLILKILTKCH